LQAQARVRRAGRTMGVVDVDVLDTAGRLVATGRGTFFLEAAK
jgi:acyl-coenzyme A thioesterase PaaI-like protein